MRSVVYDRDEKAIAELVGDGATGATSLEDMRAKLERPAIFWVMLPAGAPTDDTIEALAGHCREGDIIIDGGNSFYKDDIRRASLLAEKGIRYVDVGTSGGVWGLERGYCMMIGGDADTVRYLDPIFDALAPGLGTIPRTPDRGDASEDARAEKGYIHAGPAGAGHFVKMVHNGIEYGLMQAYAEGFDILKSKASEKLPEQRALRPQPDRHRRGLAPRQRHLVLAARSQRRGARQGPDARAVFRQCRRFGRGPLDDRGGDGRGGSRQRALGGTVRALSQPGRAYVR